MASRSITATLKGGKALKAHLAKIAANDGKGAAVNVGFLPDAVYSEDSDNPGMPVAQVAFYNEFGTSRAPPRPFMRQTVASKSPRWGNALGAALRVSDYEAEPAMAAMGELIQGQIKQTIGTLKDPPLAPYTVAKKGFDKPLIDTGTMQRKVDFEVVTGETGE